MTTSNIDNDVFKQIDINSLIDKNTSSHPVRILILYGSLREKSYSRLAAEEASRILIMFGADVKFYNPAGLPLVDEENTSHPKVLELHELVKWSEGMVWSSPERHGAMTGVMKTQIDWVPLSDGAMRPTKALLSIRNIMLKDRIEIRNNNKMLKFRNQPTPHTKTKTTYLL